jgi:23S rRNA-/tRNA-specific pseudouridylate synthase
MLEEDGMVLFTAEKEQNGIELFDLIEQQFPDFDDKAIARAFKTNAITINGKPAYGDDEVKEGDEVRFFVAGDVLGMDLTPEVIFQDENLMVLDKPAGLLSLSEGDEPNAMAIAEGFMKARGEYNLDAMMLPYLIYPLDKYVSGLLLIAKHEEAYLFLSEALAQRRISRYYICPVKGQAEEKGELLSYHTKDKAGLRATILDKVRKDAKPIVTRYETLARGEHMTLVRARALNNGLHQVRAHLAHAGLPLLGDDQYGDARFNKHSGVLNLCLWLDTLVFETGTGQGFDYLNGKLFESYSHSFAKCVYDEGLME